MCSVQLTTTSSGGFRVDTAMVSLPRLLNGRFLSSTIPSPDQP